MKAELLGGPMDGQEVNVPTHLVYLRLPVPGSAAYSIPTATDPTQAYASSIWVATYERVAFDHQKTYFRYQGQEQISS